jgi:hypothetical protein
MKYISIDIETTGLDPETCQMIEFGAIVDDLNKDIQSYNELPTFTRIIKHEKYVGQPVALGLNQRIFMELGKLEHSHGMELEDKMNELGVVDVDFFVDELYSWLMEIGYKPNKYNKIHFVLGGKNVAGFDLQFLKKLPRWNTKFIVDSRPVDPGMMYVDLIKDKRIPSLSDCKDRAGFADTIVTHNALEDAMDVIRLVRHKIGLIPRNEKENE